MTFGHRGSFAEFLPSACPQSPTYWDSSNLVSPQNWVLGASSARALHHPLLCSTWTTLTARCLSRKAQVLCISIQLAYRKYLTFWYLFETLFWNAKCISKISSFFIHVFKGKYTSHQLWIFVKISDIYLLFIVEVNFLWEKIATWYGFVSPSTYDAVFQVQSVEDLQEFLNC